MRVLRKPHNHFCSTGQPWDKPGHDEKSTIVLYRAMLQSGLIAPETPENAPSTSSATSKRE